MPTILGNANAILAIPLTKAGGGGPLPLEFFILAENGDKCITEVGNLKMVQEGMNHKGCFSHLTIQVPTPQLIYKVKVLMIIY